MLLALDVTPALGRLSLTETLPTAPVGGSSPGGNKWLPVVEKVVGYATLGQVFIVGSALYGLYLNRAKVEQAARILGGDIATAAERAASWVSSL